MFFDENESLFWRRSMSSSPIKIYLSLSIRNLLFASRLSEFMFIWRGAFSQFIFTSTRIVFGRLNFRADSFANSSLCRSKIFFFTFKRGLSNYGISLFNTFQYLRSLCELISRTPATITEKFIFSLLQKHIFINVNFICPVIWLGRSCRLMLFNGLSRVVICD